MSNPVVDFLIERRGWTSPPAFHSPSSAALAVGLAASDGDIELMRIAGQTVQEIKRSLLEHTPQEVSDACHRALIADAVASTPGQATTIRLTALDLADTVTLKEVGRVWHQNLDATQAERARRAYVDWLDYFWALKITPVWEVASQKRLDNEGPFGAVLEWRAKFVRLEDVNTWVSAQTADGAHLTQFWHHMDGPNVQPTSPYSLVVPVHCLS